jgi:DNA-binding NarL/FixJ family response regulator
MINVLLVDDHQIMREGLISLMRDATDVKVVAEALNGRMAVEKALAYSPDVVVMDLTLPEMSGIEATRQIVAANPDIKVLVLSMVLDKNCLLEILEAGAKGYLVKDCAAGELVTAIRTLAKDKPYFCAAATELIINGVTRPAAEKRVSSLTKREKEVLKLTAEGLNTKEIAYSLGVSIKTIEVNRMNLKKKLNLKSIAELTKYAVREGVSSID